jgi:hypothetical protein
VQLLSGIFQGETMGTPIGFIISNKDHRSTDYSEIARGFRPSHADYTLSSQIRATRLPWRRALVGARNCMPRGGRSTGRSGAQHTGHHRHSLHLASCRHQSRRALQQAGLVNCRQQHGALPRCCQGRRNDRCHSPSPQARRHTGWHCDLRGSGRATLAWASPCLAASTPSLQLQ